MAKIPQAPVGGINLTHETPVREIPKMQTTGDILQDVGQGITSVADVMERAYSLAEKTKAQNLLSVKLADIQSRAEADTDFSPQTRDKYHQEIDSALRESSSGISIQQNKDLFQSDAQKDADLYKLKINHDFMRKAIDSGKADLLVRRDTLKNQFIASGSPTEQNNAILQDNALIDEAVNSGFMSREDAAKAKIDRAKDWLSARVDADILADPSFAQAELTKGQQGAYAGLPEEERTKLIKEAENAVEKIAKREKENIAIATNKNESDLVDMKINGSLTVPQVKDWRNSGKITARFADSMIKALQSPKTVGARTEARTFNSIAEDIIKNENPEDIKIKLLQKNAIGELSDDDFNVLSIFNNNLTKESLDSALPKKSFLQAISFWSNENAEEYPGVASRMFKRYMKEIARGTKPEIAVNNAIKQEVLAVHPQAATYPKEGKKAMDANGVFKIITPDGQISDAEAKTQSKEK